MMADDLQGLLAQFQPSDAERKQAMYMGLLQAGLGMMASRKPAGMALGDAGIAGIGGYNGQLAQNLALRQHALQSAGAGYDLLNKKMGYEDTQAERGVLQNVYGTQGLPGLPPPGAPSTPPAVAPPTDATGMPPPNMGQQPQPDSKLALFKQYNAIADKMAASGAIAGAQRYRDMAEKARPVVDKEFDAVDTTGAPVKVVMYKDGSREVLNDLKPKEDLHFADTGAGIQPMNKATGAAVGAALQKTLAPGEAERIRIAQYTADPLGIGGLNKDGIASQGGAPGSTQGLSGDDLLKTLPPTVANQVKAYADGRMSFPAGAAMRSPQIQAMMGLVSQYDPSFDAVNYNARNAVRKDFTSGKAAVSLNALNTVMGHVDELDKAGEALDNTRFPLYNKVANAVVSAGGDPRVNRFNTAATAVVNELERAYRGSGGSEGGIQKWRETLNAASSPEQRKEVIGEMVTLLRSKMDALGDQYGKGMGKVTDGLTLLNPKAQEVFNRLGGGTTDAPKSDAMPKLTDAGAKNGTAKWIYDQAVKNNDTAAIEKLRAKGYAQ